MEADRSVHSRVDLGDLREGLNRIGIPAMPMLANASAAPRLVPLVSPRAALGKNANPDASQKSSEVMALRQSGRLDLNQRPLGPEPSALPG